MLATFRWIAVASLLCGLSGPLCAADLVQDFDAVASRPSLPSGPGNACPQHPDFIAAGWRVINQSTGAGSTPPTRCVTQGYADLALGYDPNLAFTAHEGPANAYAGFPSVAATAPGQPTSLWLISPRLYFGQGAQVSFWMRRVNALASVDRMQVRLMVAPGDPNVGVPGDADGTGDFTEVLLDINPFGSDQPFLCQFGDVIDPVGRFLPNLAFHNWCKIILTSASGLPNSGSGYLAFRYLAPATVSAPFPYFAAIDSFRFDSGEIDSSPPLLSWILPPDSQLSASGGPRIGDTAVLAQEFVAADGSGPPGPDNTTTFQCAPVTAPFAGFSEVITAVSGEPPAISALTGTCVRSADTVFGTASCSVQFGNAAPSPVEFALRCDAASGAKAYGRYADAVRSDDPALYWRMGEAAGDAINVANGPSSVGNIGNGSVVTTLRGMYSVPPLGTPLDRAMTVFYGESGLRSGVFDKLVPDADGLSLELWVNIFQTNGFTNLVGDRPAALGQSLVFLYLRPDGGLRFHVNTDDGLNAVDTVGPPLAPSRSYHIVATWDRTTGQMRVYIDGQEVVTEVTAGSNPTSGPASNGALNPIMVGADLSETYVNAVFTADEVAVYPRVLSPDRIRVHHDLGTMLGDGFGD